MKAVGTLLPHLMKSRDVLLRKLIVRLSKNFQIVEGLKFKRTSLRIKVVQHFWESQNLHSQLSKRIIESFFRRKTVGFRFK